MCYSSASLPPDTLSPSLRRRRNCSPLPLCSQLPFTCPTHCPGHSWHWKFRLPPSHPEQMLPSQQELTLQQGYFLMCQYPSQISPFQGSIFHCLWLAHLLRCLSLPGQPAFTPAQCSLCLGGPAGQPVILSKLGHFYFFNVQNAHVWLILPAASCTPLSETLRAFGPVSPQTMLISAGEQGADGHNQPCSDGSPSPCTSLPCLQPWCPLFSPTTGTLSPHSILQFVCHPSFALFVVACSFSMVDLHLSRLPEKSSTTTLPFTISHLILLPTCSSSY